LTETAATCGLLIEVMLLLLLLLQGELTMGCTHTPCC
jgi:hypothetical protein